MKLKGTVKKIFDTRTVGANGFQIREMVLLTDENYPQPIKIEFVQEKTRLLDDIKEGDEVEVSFDVRGREWVNPEGKTVYFVSIRGWRIDKPYNMPADDNMPPFPTADDAFGNDDFNQAPDDDLPF